MKKSLLPILITILGLFVFDAAYACTGITLNTSTGQTVLARTIEWAAEPINMMYVVVPPDFKHRSLLPDGTPKGMRFQGDYGYVGIAVEEPSYILEGVNEFGLAAGLFYFSDCGQYHDFDPKYKDSTISDMQLVSWILASFVSVDEMLKVLPSVRIISIDPRASTAHWRVADSSGRQVVIEVVNKRLQVYDNPVGVLTNSPSFPWHLTNLDNHLINMLDSVDTFTFDLLNLPGDMSSASRFLRAAYFQMTAPKLNDCESTVLQSFHIMNNFEIPIGTKFEDKTLMPQMHTSTQATIVTDLANSRLYYRTMYNPIIRCLDIQNLDFETLSYQVEILENSVDEPIEYIDIY
jgi:choloylglycine hydrolase